MAGSSRAVYFSTLKKKAHSFQSYPEAPSIGWRRLSTNQVFGDRSTPGNPSLEDKSFILPKQLPFLAGDNQHHEDFCHPEAHKTYCWGINTAGADSSNNKMKQEKEKLVFTKMCIWFTFLLCWWFDFSFFSTGSWVYQKTIVLWLGPLTSEEC